MECRNLMNSIVSLFLLPRRLHPPNLCQGPGITPCLWKNPRLLSALLWRNPRCL